MSEECDVVVIGGGAAGENVAGRAAAGGLDVVLVEHDLVGGECSYWACMPSKALLRPGEALAAARRVQGAAPAVTGTVDVEATLRSRDAFISELDDSSQVQWLADAGVRLMRGLGRIAGPRAVMVDGGGSSPLMLRARKGVVLATGSTPTPPPIDGLSDIAAWDSRQATTAKEIPGRLLVLGGGAVGVELAQAYAWLGADVTVLEASEGLLDPEEPFAGEEVAEALRALGVEVVTGARVSEVARQAGDDAVTATLADGRQFTGDQLLVATGRQPRTEGLGLEDLGVDPEALEVDEQLRVVGAQGWLYAVGDVNGRNLLTHMGKYQARLAADHLLGKSVEAWADHRAVPRVVFTDPQVAAVGMTEAQAREAGLAIAAVSHSIPATAGGALLGEGVRGTAKLVIDTDRQVLVGATFTGPQVGELLHAATIAVAAAVPVSVLWHAVPSFPTVSEVWLRLLESHGL